MLYTLEKDNEESVNEICSELLKYTPQLLQYNSVKPLPFGSSILVELHNNFFLITAGHCMNHFNLDHNRKIGINIGNNISVLQGDAIYINKDLPQIDLAIWKISDRFREDVINMYNFFKLDNFNYNLDLLPNQKYMLFGFPNSQTKMYVKKRKALLLNTETSLNYKYIDLKLSPKSHMLLEFDRKKVYEYNSENSSEASDPDGLSGCGVWVSPSMDLKTGFHPLKFPIAIATHYNTKLKVMIATRINVAIELIRIKYKIDVPKSNLINLNIT